MLDNDAIVATMAAASAIVCIFFWMRGNGTKDAAAGIRDPPSSSILSLLRAVLRGGVGVLPDHFMKSAEALGPVISYNFGGSSDTVSTTLMWAMVELANHPEVQTRFQREIDEVVPQDRLPSLDDKPRMLYTEAVILEVMRRRTLIPFYLPHSTIRDAEVLGFFIPKECLVLANAYSVHMDPKSWNDPENFRPERHLDENHMIVGSEKVIPFGLGKRSCLGEILGRQQIFLFLTSLIQSFDIRPPQGQDSIRVTDVIGLGVFPSEFQVRMIPRVEDQKEK